MPARLKTVTTIKKEAHKDNERQQSFIEHMEKMITEKELGVQVRFPKLRI